MLAGNLVFLAVAAINWLAILPKAGVECILAFVVMYGVTALWVAGIEVGF